MCESGSSGGEEYEKDEIRSEKFGKEKEDFGKIEIKEERVRKKETMFWIFLEARNGEYLFR